MSKGEKTLADLSAEAHETLFNAREALNKKPSKAAADAVKAAAEAAAKAKADLLKEASQRAVLASKGQASNPAAPQARPGSPGGERLRVDSGLRR